MDLSTVGLYEMSADSLMFRNMIRMIGLKSSNDKKNKKNKNKEKKKEKERGNCHPNF